MNSHVDFEFSKKFGENEKGDKKNFYRPFARRLQDIRKVGKIVDDDEHNKVIKEKVVAAKKKAPAKKKEVKPPEDKTDKFVSTRSIKSV